MVRDVISQWFWKNVQFLCLIIVTVSIYSRLFCIFGLSDPLSLAGREVSVDWVYWSCQNFQTALRVGREVSFLPALFGLQTYWILSSILNFCNDSLITSMWFSAFEVLSFSIYEARSSAKRLFLFLVFGVKLSVGFCLNLTGVWMVVVEFTGSGVSSVLVMVYKHMKSITQS